MINVLPRQLGDVNQSVYATQVHEGTEVDDGGHDALADLALLELVQELGTNLGLSLLQPCTAGQHDIVAVLVQLDDLGFDLLADVWLQIAHAAHFHEGCWQEATQTDVQDEATLDNLDNGTGNWLVLFLELLDGTPSTLVLCALLGKDQATFLVLLGENKCVNLVADFNDLAWVYVVLDGQLTGWDYTLGLVADVQKDLVVIDLDDGAFHNVTIIEVLDGGIDGSEEILSGANIVNGDLRDVVGGHVVVVSETDRISVGQLQNICERSGLPDQRVLPADVVRQLHPMIFEPPAIWRSIAPKAMTFKGSSRLRPKLERQSKRQS